jgi:hypothetical protein
MFTNAINLSKINDKVAEAVDEIRISLYEYNKKTSPILKKKYPNKVRIKDQTEFWVNPPGKVDGATPAICLNPEFMYFNRKIYACSHSLSIAKGCNNSSVKLSVPLEEGFASKLKEIRKKQEEDICSRCISNQKVRDVVVKKKNINESKSTWGSLPVIQNTNDN